MIERSRSPKGNGSPRVTVVIALCLALIAGFPGALTQAGAGTLALLDAPSFSPVGSMTEARNYHTATLLGNGKVLIAGGLTPTGYTNTAELFDPTSGTFTATSNTMTSARASQTATLLPSGKVLIAGGYTPSGSTNTAELFDPASGTFTSLSPNTMTSVRYDHTATLLPSGKILIAGGTTTGFAVTNTAELFDPASGTFTSLSPNTMTSARVANTATLLPSGKVLIAGGFTGSEYLNTAELFDPASGSFTSLSPSTMTSARHFHTATLLPSGKVLIAGGYTTGIAVTNTAELFDPASGTFMLLPPMTSPRYIHTATLLASGKVLIAGGATPGGPMNTAELFDPALGIFTSLLPTTMASARSLDTATLLPSGKVLIAGGTMPNGLPTNTAELFDPASGTFTATSNTMNLGRYIHTATLLPSGKVLIAGGYTNTAELFDPAFGTFTLVPNTMTSIRFFHTATLLSSGKVLIAGGIAGATPTNTVDMFDPASGTFTSLPSMTSARYGHTATLLPSGKVLIAGGSTTSGPTNTAELFDPASGTFTSLPPMTSARFRHTATLLGNGKVLLAGGSTLSVGATTNTTELFDPASGTFTSLPSMTSARYYHTATLLPSGKILIAGGSTDTTVLNTAELFDPGSGTFTSLPSMTSARYGHTGTLLANGQVLLAGGRSDETLSGVTNTAELFDTALGTFTSLLPNTMTSARFFHTATLLASGKILVAGGSTGGLTGTTNTAELFDTGLGFSDARRPVVATTTNPLVQPASLVLTGTGFRGDSEGSGSSFNSSATNYPLLQLMWIDNGQTFFPLSEPATNWSDTMFSSETLGAVTPLPAGHYRVTIFTNAIPSFPKIINITPPPRDTAADLALTKTDSKDPAPTARNLTYTLTATNNGPDPASGVIVTDQLPPSVTFVSATPSQGTCTEAGGTVTCSLGTMASGATATVQIVVTPRTVGLITNTASVTASTTELNPDNNAASEDTSICRITSRRSSIPCG